MPEFVRIKGRWNATTLAGWSDINRVVNRYGAVLTLLLGLTGSLLAQDLIDKSAPNDGTQTCSSIFQSLTPGSGGFIA
jgi:uncharacterized membrane protein YeaQ/YmgE (transglycosylase-associated protein family)